MTRITLTTAHTPGAVAIVQLHGGGANASASVAEVLSRLTGRDAFADRRAVLCSLADIDEGLVVRIGETAQLMPHGGPRVVQKLIEHLTTTLGCAYDPAPDTRTLYPEANSHIEADMLDAIARAASPAAIDLLAMQPQRWATLLKQGGLSPDICRSITERSRTLYRLITPPTVVVVGPANVGKSTLTNALMGRAVSIVADLPGTTRDWVGALVELSGDLGVGGLDLGEDQDRIDAVSPISQPPTPKTQIAVNWLDTPGLRTTDDAIEQRAIQLARQQVERADVLIAMRDPQQPWPDAEALPRVPDLWVVNKMDDTPAVQHASAGASADTPMQISAANHLGLDRLQHAVIDRLGLTTISCDEPWAFSQTLRRACESSERESLDRYLVHRHDRHT